MSITTARAADPVVRMAATTQGPPASDAEESAGGEAVRRLRERLVDDLDDGFGLLVETYQDLMFSVALRTTSRHADAEDLCSDAFLRAYRALRRYDVERLSTLHPRAWLVTILVNTRRSQVRDASRRPDTADRRLPERASTETGVEEQVAGRETSEELAALLDELPEAHRTVLVLRYVTDLSFVEVAQCLGCPVGTAKSHASRGLARMRGLLGRDFVSDATDRRAS